MGRQILIVEDDERIGELLREVLGREGLGEPVIATSVAQAVELAQKTEPTLAILDVGLPDGSGIDVATMLRARSDVPILFLSARDTDADKLAGFGAGADDYVTKPFNLMEIVARVRALLRRSGRAGETTTIHDLGRVLIEEEAGRLVVDGSEVPVPAREFKLLCFMASNPGRIFSASQLYRQVWQEEPVGRSDDKTVAVHIHRIRERVEADPSQPSLIVTIRGLGYKLVEPARSGT